MGPDVYRSGWRRGLGACVVRACCGGRIKINTTAAVVPPAIMAVRFAMEMVVVVVMDLERVVSKEVTCVYGWQWSSKSKWMGNVQ